MLICGLLHGDAGVVVMLSDHSLEDLHFLFVSISPSHGRRFLRPNSFQYNNGEFLCFSLSKDCNFSVVALISSIPIQLRVFRTFLQFFFSLKNAGTLEFVLLSPECQGLNWVTIRSDRFNKKKREDHVFRRSLVSGSMISLKTCRTKKVKGGLACFQ